MLTHPTKLCIADWPIKRLFNRTSGDTETAISGDTGADWSHVFALVPSLDNDPSSKLAHDPLCWEAA